MSNQVFPSLPGLSWDVVKRPEFATKVQRSVSGREFRAAFMQYPLWSFDLSYEFLRGGNLGAEMKTLAGFFLQMRGQFDSFLFTDPADSAVTDQSFGLGDGVTTQFQLVRAYGAGGFAFIEPVQNVNALINVKVGGVAKTAGIDFTVDANGLVTFASAPADGVPLTWTGTYYFRCRFTQDEAEFNNFMRDLWELKSLSFVGAPGNKV